MISQVQIEEELKNNVVSLVSQRTGDTLARTRPQLSIPMSDVQPEKVDWLWYPYIPLGKVTILDGDPGVGKSFLTIEIASRVSCGDRLPGMDGKPKPGAVLLLAMEDGAGDTIRPRLDACGAAVEHIHLIEDPLPLNEDAVKRLKAEVERLGARLVMIDPFSSYVPNSSNIAESKEMRPVINRLVTLAADTGAAVVLVRHLNKGQGGAMYKGFGSIDIIAGCRSGLMVGLDPNNGEKSILAHYKHNLTAQGPSLAFSKRDGNFKWLGKSSLRADDLVAPPDDRDTRSAVEEAAEFLTEELAAGPREATELRSEANKQRISFASLRRAKDQLGVRPKKVTGGKWVWELPPAEGGQGAQSTPDEHLEHVEYLTLAEEISL